MENTISIYKSFKNIEDSADSCSEPFSWKGSGESDTRTLSGQAGHLPDQCLSDEYSVLASSGAVFAASRVQFPYHDYSLFSIAPLSYKSTLCNGQRPAPRHPHGWRSSIE